MLGTLLRPARRARGCHAALRRFRGALGTAGSRASGREASGREASGREAARQGACLFSTSAGDRIERAVREHLEGVVRRNDGLVEKLGGESAGLSQEELAATSKEIAELSKLVQAKTKMDNLQREMEDLRQMMTMTMASGEGSTPPAQSSPQNTSSSIASTASTTASETEELAKLAAQEHEELRVEYDALVDAVVDDMLPRDEMDAKGCVVEVRAGTGGEEACLFARDLFQMYERFCAYRGWAWETVEQSASAMGDGYKVAIATVSARKGAGHDGPRSQPYGVLKYESGVHRVQRVPATESGGRIHTSAASVTILPEADTLDIDIREEDIRIDTYRSSGAGGQHVNTTNSAVRVTHVPTGTSVAIQDERSQHKNKAKALAVLRARIYDAEQQRLRSEQSHARKQQIGTGDRSQRVRTYNQPQSRVTDHRCARSVHGDLTATYLLDGPVLEDLVDELQLYDRRRAIEALFGNASN